MTNLFHLGAIQGVNVLIQLLLVPLVISRVGIEINGKVLTALSIAGLFSILINFTSNQTTPLVLSKKEETEEVKAKHLSEMLLVRLGWLLIISLVLVGLHFFIGEFGIYLIGIIPLLMAEAINPYVIYLSLNKLSYLNVANLLGRLLGFIAVYLLVHTTRQAPWVNTLVGAGLFVIYSVLWKQLLYNKWVRINKFSVSASIKWMQAYVSLLGNNLIVQLQQSVFLYVLGLSNLPLLTGVYAIIDKLVWGARTLLIAFSNAIYTLSIATHARGKQEWKKFRGQVNQFLFFVLIAAGIVLLLLAPQLATWLGEPSQHDLLITYLRWMAFIPLIIALNVLNVLDLLQHKAFQLQFKIGIILLLLSFVMAAAMHLLLGIDSDKYFLLPVSLLMAIETLTLLFYIRARARFN
jgi:PST family polysaccharide transporter